MARHVHGPRRSGCRPDQVEPPVRVRLGELIELVDPLPVDVLTEIDEPWRPDCTYRLGLNISELDPVRDHRRPQPRAVAVDLFCELVRDRHQPVESREQEASLSTLVPRRERRAGLEFGLHVRIELGDHARVAECVVYRRYEEVVPQ